MAAGLDQHAAQKPFKYGPRTKEEFFRGEQNMERLNEKRSGFRRMMEGAVAVIERFVPQRKQPDSLSETQAVIDQAMKESTN